MTTISFSGSGTPAVDQNSASGQGQGLQVGQSIVNFLTGAIHLNIQQQTLIGRFLGLTSKDSTKDGIVNAFVFKAKAVCTIQLGDNAPFLYQTLNEWVTFKHVNFSKATITRSSTGQTPDIFDWDFMASDDADFDFQIQQVSRESETEVIFSNAARAQNGGVNSDGVYTQTTNLRGAKKIKVNLVTNQTGAETGTVDVSLEHYDTASGLWLPTLQATDLFGVNIPRNEILSQDVGDTIQQNGLSGDNSFFVQTTPSSRTIDESKNLPELVSNISTIPIIAQIGTILPSGDNIFRIKAIVKVSTLTFSIGIIKVFE